MSTEQSAPAQHDVPGMRTMAVVRWLLLLALACLAGFTWWKLGPTAETTAQGPDRYYCPMHPEIRSPNPGTCPICFMSLEPIPPSGGMDHAMPHPSGPPPAPSAMPAADVMLTLERRQSIGLATAAATKKKVARELRLPAVLEAPESAISEVRVRSAGFVEQVAPIETGAKVKAGEALLWVYSPDILRTQQELLTARALSSGGAPAVHDDAEMVDAAKTRLELLGVGRGVSNQVLAKGKSVRAIPVSAPKTGIVTARNVSLGAYVTPETMLFQITDLSTLWVSATAETADVALLAPKTRARFESRRGTAIDVEALLVEPRVAARTRTATVRFLAKNDDASLLPGDIGEVVVPTTDEEQVVVPRDAVVDTGAQTYVFVEKSPGRFTPRAITAGPIVGNDRIVKSGVEPGEAIVVRGAFLLDSESRLQGALAPSMDKAP